jgi:hypothetical protein
MSSSGPNGTVISVNDDAVERARTRLSALRADEAEKEEVSALLERARQQLESFAQSTAELEATLPERVSNVLHDSLRAEVVPVARQLAEVRGLSAQTIRRLESLHTDLAAERKARVEDLELLVDLIVSGWRGVDRRIDRLERTLDRLERALDERAPSGSLLRLEERKAPR